MIIETSALVAILKGEEGWQDIVDCALASPQARLVSAASYLETAIVTDKRDDPVRLAALDSLIEDLGAQIEPVTETQAKLARKAYQTFGKGSGHPAKLNFGDCFAYALAIEQAQPLLFKGNDFTATDVRQARE